LEEAHAEKTINKTKAIEPILHFKKFIKRFSLVFRHEHLQFFLETHYE
jgi:hypothetical protein